MTIAELIERERADACCAGMRVEQSMWYRLGPFAVSINWYPFRFMRWWKSRLRGEYMGEQHRWWQLGPRYR